jgi:hypothetical protein
VRIVFESPDSHVATAAEQAAHVTSFVAVIDCQEAALDLGFGLAANGAGPSLASENGLVHGQADAVLLPEALVTHSVAVGLLVRPSVVGVDSPPARRVLASLSAMGGVVLGLLESLARFAPVGPSTLLGRGSVKLRLGLLLLALGARKNVHAGEV